MAVAWACLNNEPLLWHNATARTSEPCLIVSASSGWQVVTTISRGRLVWHNGVLDVTPGTGRFIPMPTHGMLFEGLDKQDAAYLATNFPYGSTPVPRGQPVQAATASKDEL